MINDFLKRNTEKKLSIFCFGDAVIDEYYQVKVDRISPEFPMPVMIMQEEKPIRKLGGVANVIMQFKHFNIDTYLCSFVDSKLEFLLQQNNIDFYDSEFMVSGKKALIPVKKRFLDGEVQVTRLDIEKANYGLQKHEIDKYLPSMISQIGSRERPDVVVLSDYCKGFFSSNFNWCKNVFKDSITIVDPKQGSLDQWVGCTIFKPNAKEAKILSGCETWQEQAFFFEKVLGCRAVVITHGDEGVYGSWDGTLFEYHPSESVKVKSVVGAGDCFTAFLAMAVGHGFQGMDAIKIAYKAGSRYVQGIYNKPIFPVELSDSKIVSAHDLKNRDFKLAFQNGCFDIIHSGHLQALRFAASKADKLVVALNSDASVKRLKGDSRPIKPLHERMAVMASLEMVDFVVSFEEDTPLEVIKACRPDVLVKGAQYGEGTIVGEDIVPETYRAPMIDGVSTTTLLDKLHPRN